MGEGKDFNGGRNSDRTKASSHGEGGGTTKGCKSHRHRAGRGTSRRHHDEPVELANKQDCLKCMKDFNRETARYCCLIPAIGSSVDNTILRHELKCTWKRARDLAHQNKTKLLPHLKGRLCKIDEVEEYEKIWTTFGSCLENLQLHMRRTITLLPCFPLHGDYTPLVRTGQIEAIPSHRSFGSAQPAAGHSLVAVEPMDSAHSGGDASPDDLDCLTLQQDICDISTMLVEIQEIVDVKPWTIEPEIDTTKIIERTSSLHSDELSEEGSQEAPTSDMVSVFNMTQHRRKKCIGLLLLLICGLGVFATVLGVCIALL